MLWIKILTSASSYNRIHFMRRLYHSVHRVSVTNINKELVGQN